MREYIIKTADEPDIMGGYPLVEPAVELVRCKDCRFREDEKAKASVTQYLPCEGFKPYGNWYCAYAERLKAQPQIEPSEAEMAVEHTDGTVEYVKDIDSVMLLAHKDYHITYTGEF